MSSVVYNFLITHQFVAVGIIIAMILLLWKKPIAFFKLAFAILLIVVVIYIGALLGGGIEGGPRYNKGVPNQQEIDEIK